MSAVDQEQLRRLAEEGWRGVEFYFTRLRVAGSFFVEHSWLVPVAASVVLLLTLHKVARLIGFRLRRGSAEGSPLRQAVRTMVFLCLLAGWLLFGAHFAAGHATRVPYFQDLLASGLMLNLSLALFTVGLTLDWPETSFFFFAGFWKGMWEVVREPQEQTGDAVDAFVDSLIRVTFVPIVMLAMVLAFWGASLAANVAEALISEYQWPSETRYLKYVPHAFMALVYCSMAYLALAGQIVETSARAWESAGDYDMAAAIRATPRSVVARNYLLILMRAAAAGVLFGYSVSRGGFEWVYLWSSMVAVFGSKGKA